MEKIQKQENVRILVNQSPKFNMWLILGNSNNLWLVCMNQWLLHSWHDMNKGWFCWKLFFICSWKDLKLRIHPLLFPLILILLIHRSVVWEGHYHSLIRYVYSCLSVLISAFNIFAATMMR
jgi:hypothetical protein